MPFVCLMSICFFLSINNFASKNTEPILVKIWPKMYVEKKELTELWKLPASGERIY